MRYDISSRGSHDHDPHHHRRDVYGARSDSLFRLRQGLRARGNPPTCATHFASRWWWVVGAGAVATSQAAILSSSRDDGVGTVANVVLLTAVAYGFPSRGPLSLRAEFERRLARVRPPVRAASSGAILDGDLASLPDPVQRYLRRSGVVGRPAGRDRLPGNLDRPHPQRPGQRMDDVCCGAARSRGHSGALLHHEREDERTPSGCTARIRRLRRDDAGATSVCAVNGRCEGRRAHSRRNGDLNQ